MFKKLKQGWQQAINNRNELVRLRRFIKMLSIVAAEEGAAIVFDTRGVTIEAYKMEGDVRVRKFQITDEVMEGALYQAIITIANQGQSQGRG